MGPVSRWNLAAVEKAAPDASSLTAARKLAHPGPWSDTGSTETLVWGKCQGSGKTPYQVSIDLNGPAYRCSCPSRKFPCKHALALLLLWVQGAGTVADASTPADFAGEWADQRATRAQRPAATAPVDPEARARRLAERQELMSAGIDDFALWLADLVRAGTAQARRQGYSWWDGAAARLVDAQLPGLADRVRTAGSEVSRDDDWAERLLAELGRWWAAVNAWRSWEALDERTRADLRTYLGWAQPTDELRTGGVGEQVEDSWLVLGAHRSEDGRLTQQRTWLRGDRSGEVVLLLDFAAGGAPLPVAHLTGSVLDGTLALYPGSGPRRALVLGEARVRRDVALAERLDPAGDATASTAVDDLRASWADNPWNARVPVVLAAAAVVPTRDGSVVAADGSGVLRLLGDRPAWDLLARTGGHPTLLVGELEETGLRVLSVRVGDELVAV